MDATTNDTKNLTDPVDILYAMQKKFGKRGVLTWFADKHGYSKGYMSLTMNGDRCNPEIIQLFANYLDCTVYGIEPEKKQEIYHA